MLYPRYNKDLEFSYCFGIYPVLELLLHKPKHVLEVIISSKSTDSNSIGRIIELCDTHDIKISYDDVIIDKLTNNESIYVVGVFKKYTSNLETNKNHVLLVNPTDMGNVGTIMRTSLAFNYSEIGIIKPGVDIYDPKVIRSSMGAIFSLNIAYFDSFEIYSETYHDNACYAFMTDGETSLTQVVPKPPYTLIFGSEGEGLPLIYKKFANPVSITQSNNVDSLNLAISVGIGLYEFSKNK